MGVNIALTGLILFLFGLFIACIAKSPPEQRGLLRMFGVVMLVGLFMIPLGLIIRIWE